MNVKITFAVLSTSLAAWTIPVYSAEITGYVVWLIMQLFYNCEYYGIHTLNDVVLAVFRVWNMLYSDAARLIGALDGQLLVIKVFLGAAVLLVSAVLPRYRHTSIGRWLNTLRLMWTGKTLQVRDLRGKWQSQFSLPQIPIRPEHSHGESAAHRTSSSVAIDSFICKLGCTPYVVSFSARELEGSEGYHAWHIMKDAAIDPREDPVNDNHIIKMVDVDYYVDMDYWASFARPMLLYTFVPTSVSATRLEYNYQFDSDNYVSYQTYGGRTYKHQVWDYSTDTICFRTGLVTNLICSVDVKQVDEHHRIVLINPIRVVWSLHNLFPNWIKSSMPFEYLRRVRVAQHNGTLITRYTNDKGDWVSIRPKGLISTADVPLITFETAQIRYVATKNPMMSDINRYLKEAKLENTDALAAILHQAFSVGQYELGPITVTKAGKVKESASKDVRHYQGIEPLVDDSGREIGRSVAKSIVKYPDFIPNKSFNNDWLSIEYRVKKVVNDVVVPPRFLKFADEFIQRVLGDNKGVGVPIDHHQVRQMQKKPMQRARLEKSEYWILSDPSINIRSFMKSETYGKVNAPRNISTVGVTHTIQLSAYTYAFKKSVLYPKRWYAPGKSPQEIARRVAEIANNYNKVSETDYEKFDGTVSFWLRENIEQAMYLKWCAPEYREHLNELLSQEINQYARTSHNLPYEPRASRLSGSPLTTDGNTLINAFVSYAALRSANVSADHAYDYLGIYGGDDGISTVSSSHLNRAAKDLGLRLKCIERRVSNNDVVTFLGRVYPNAWFGDMGSIQDPMRTWKKLHISFANPNITDNQALADRALGYYLLDTNAPITSEWCVKALEVSGKEGRITEYDTPFFVRSEVGECYGVDGKLIEDLSGPTTKIIGRTKVPLEVNGWPQLGFDAAVEAISRMTGMTAAEIESVNDKIKMAQTLEELEGIITNEDTAPAVVAAVGHDIVTPPKSDAASNNTVVVARKPSRRNTRRNGKDHPNEGRERSKPRTGGGTVHANLPRSEASSSMPAKLPSARKGDLRNKPTRVTQSDNGATIKRRTRTPKRST